MFHTRVTRNAAHYEVPKARAPIEKLPPEIRLLVFANLGLDSLKSLVRASLIFHEQYSSDRIYILRKCLQNTLGVIGIDACAAYRAGTESFARTRNEVQIENFLDTYMKRLFSGNPNFTGDLTNDEILDFVKIHFSTTRPLLIHFTEWALANLANADSKTQISTKKFCRLLLSRSEELRILRGLYRFQLFCNLFGCGPHIIEPPFIDFHFGEIFNIFFHKFEPWETEEVGCIYIFAEQKFDQIFKTLPADTHWVVVVFHERLNEPLKYCRLGLLDATISRGLELLSTVLRTQDKNKDLLISTMQRYISEDCGYFHTAASGADAQTPRWEHFPSDRDDKQRRLDPLPFDKDDDEPDVNNPHPPLAWTLMWKGTYSVLCGGFLPDEFRECSYVMWDADRINYYGGKAIFERYLEERYEDWDERDILA
ncbi:hypothetical protein FQN57_002131 [Myotisia sp. PD_48]|nr:hypothetical protein FQN57_002131 [Myotisia sp. PD_48]